MDSYTKYWHPILKNNSFCNPYVVPPSIASNISRYWCKFIVNVHHLGSRPSYPVHKTEFSTISCVYDLGSPIYICLLYGVILAGFCNKNCLVETKKSPQLNWGTFLIVAGEGDLPVMSLSLSPATRNTGYLIKHRFICRTRDQFSLLQ